MYRHTNLFPQKTVEFYRPLKRNYLAPKPIYFLFRAESKAASPIKISPSIVFPPNKAVMMPATAQAKAISRMIIPAIFFFMFSPKSRQRALSMVQAKVNKSAASNHSSFIKKQPRLKIKYHGPASYNS